MSPKEFVSGLLTYLRKLKADGQEIVPMDGVINNLSVLQKSLERSLPEPKN
ncbi:MAG: hypothetical protein ABIR38_00285 [Chthoniobacterales bacterium]